MSGLHYYIDPGTPTPPTPPVAFEIEVDLVGNILANSATAVWSTNKWATSFIKYGLTPDVLDHTVYVSGVAMIFEASLTGLIMQQDYFYEITATAVTGEIATKTGTFTTTNEMKLENAGISNSLLFELLTRQILDFIPDWTMATEILMTIEPDADNYALVDMATSTHDKVELAFENSSTDSDFDVAVTP